MSLFGLIGGIIGSKKAKKYGKKAAKAQIAAIQKGIGETNAQFDETEQSYSPWIQGGQQGFGALLDMVGLNGPEKQALAMQGIQSSPMMESMVRNGEEALLQNASATGGLRGGDTQRGLADQRADIFSQLIQQQMQRLGGVAGFGANATRELGQFGAAKSSDIAQMFMGQGAAKAGDYLNRGALANKNWQNIGAFGDQAASAAMAAFGMPSMPGGGGGGGGGGFGSFNPMVFAQKMF